MKRPRLFIALPFSGGVKKNLVQLQDELRQQMPQGWRWTDSESFHITLRFVGEVGHDEIVPICEAAVAATHGIAPFEYRLEGLGVFPRVEAPRVLWVGVTGDAAAEDGPLRELNRRLEQSILELGYRGEPLAFRPHVTLARSQKGEAVDAEALKAALQKAENREVAKVFAREVVTYNSILQRSGALYEAMARAPLPAGG